MPSTTGVAPPSCRDEDQPRIAISGHRGLPRAIAALVEAELKRALDDVTDVIGLSCLADGADQIFARAVVEVGGRLEVVVPAQKYREGLPREAWSEYDVLIGRADRVHRLDFVALISPRRSLIGLIENPYFPGPVPT
ncbi:hypothetical protein ACQP1V_04530 [Microtetraspora malaysiensis]|uniref:hypothetical protein n=1 Tax=Microtetraspora malaysiensis TaxID=161358 RepID=UPI003D8E79CC